MGGVSNRSLPAEPGIAPSRPTDQETLSDAETRLRAPDLPPQVAAELRLAAMQAAFRLGDGDAARRHGFAALRLAHDRFGPAERARAHNGLAVVFGADGLFAEALDHLWQAVHLREEAGLDVDGALLNNLANVYVELGRHDEAVGLLDRAVERARASGDHGVAATALANLGRTHVRAGRPALAIPALDAALETFERLDRPGDVAATLAKLGAAHGAAGAAASAQRVFERALALHGEGHGVRFEDETRAEYGRWALSAGESTIALEQLQAVVALCGDDDEAVARTDVLEPLSRALEAAGRLGEALAVLRRHVALQADRRAAEADATARVRLLELQHGVQGDQEIARWHALELERRNAELRERAARLEKLSVTDALTGLRNRRALDRRLREETTRATRYGHPLVLALLDLDRFKEINDGFSHDVGDRVLVHVARLLAAHLRASDLAARWGGEEFALLFPETDLRAAAPILDRLRRALADHDWSRVAPDLRVTASIGVASLAEVSGPETLLRLADRRLYSAKHAGRDRTVSDEAGAPRPRDSA